jgi:regulator of protease activity HflC (stomatin/prohibitin superfamily)
VITQVKLVVQIDTVVYFQVTDAQAASCEVAIRFGQSSS